MGAMSDEPTNDTDVLPHNLRWIADWLDFTDRHLDAVTKAAAESDDFDPVYVREAMGVLAANTIQADLRRWADLLEAGGDPQVSEMQRTIDDLQQRINIMVQDQDVGVRKMHFEDNELNMQLDMPHWASNLFAASFADSLLREGATNFLEMSFVTDKGPLLVTLQAPRGKTPAVLLREEKDRVAKLEALAGEAAAVIRAAQSDRSIHSHRAGSELDIMVRRLEKVASDA